MPEWLVERGIGETRAVLVEQGRIVEARIELEGTIAAGSIIEARLKTSGTPAVAVASSGEFLLPGGAPRVTEGASLRIEVTREAIPGPEPWKRPLARVVDEVEAVPPPPLQAEILPFPGGGDRLAALGWLDLLDEARSGIVALRAASFASS